MQRSRGKDEADVVFEDQQEETKKEREGGKMTMKKKHGENKAKSRSEACDKQKKQWGPL